MSVLGKHKLHCKICECHGAWAPESAICSSLVDYGCKWHMCTRELHDCKNYNWQSEGAHQNACYKRMRIVTHAHEQWMLSNSILSCGGLHPLRSNCQICLIWARICPLALGYGLPSL